MSRDLRVPAVILSPRSPRLERIFLTDPNWPFVGGILDFWSKTMEIMAKSWLILYES